MVIAVPPVPGPAFVGGVVVSTWLDAAPPTGLVAWMLIAHPPPRRPGESVERIETSLLGMAGGLGLRAASGRVPNIGDRLTVRGPHLVLDYGHPDFCLRVPRPTVRWAEHVLGGVPVCLVIGLDAIASGAGRDAIEGYVDRSTARDRAYMGATAVCRP
ncbi:MULTISPECIES: hypothetical protein [Streptomyces]|uniref:Uncharacterized protein n=2 Tax=Streptomyces rimosus subsp. rimosus TaxID=132474 RepID=L8ERF4_STRR1|nr:MULTISPECIES: hypothetical protein [Streptomyces]KOG67865.1 hypothetical protein ADK78_39200 [Kitasatospora aureofaciens]MYT48697.1 hypothetical protein [Streptomyces sp. SID5471]KEF06216.1 hypothetical protein DF17_15050 [Streptomyces rimosus]KEF17762.1 hypothetical protein DF18_27090 [Streptomyces rimosus]KOT30086.1 hypothetical protein ADK42_30805 [Streptomyces rimosus subsp. rimosus]